MSRKFFACTLILVSVFAIFIVLMLPTSTFGSGCDWSDAQNQCVGVAAAATESTDSSDLVDLKTLNVLASAYGYQFVIEPDGPWYLYVLPSNLTSADLDRDTVMRIIIGKQNGDDVVKDKYRFTPEEIRGLFTWLATQYKQDHAQSAQPVCGNAVCEVDETSKTCSQDCAP